MENKNLSGFKFPGSGATLSRKEKDKIDLKINQLIQKRGLSSVIGLIPSALRARWKALFGKEFKTILKYSFKELPRVVRINTLKINKRNFQKITKKYSWKLKSLKISNAFIVVEKKAKKIEVTSEYKDGFFYSQQLASMLPVIILSPKPGEKILDIGAAPGSKTTQMAQLMENKGKIMANDISRERIKILKKNIKRLGIKNVRVNLGDGQTLGRKYSEKFDKALIDSPCSSEGIIRYKPHKLIEWSLQKLHTLTRIQKKLLESGFNALKPGGVLIYSTCTYGVEENEAVIDCLLRKYPSADIAPIKLKSFKFRQGLLKWKDLKFDKRIRNAVRIYPYDIDSVGFFICKIVKK